MTQPIPSHPLPSPSSLALPTEPYLSADINTVASSTCDLCGCDRVILRAVTGPRSFGAALAHHASPHHHIRCPHADSLWHRHARALLIALQSQPSPRLAALIQQDLHDLLSSSLSLPSRDDT